MTTYKKGDRVRVWMELKDGTRQNEGDAVVHDVAPHGVLVRFRDGHKARRMPSKLQRR